MNLLQGLGAIATAFLLGKSKTTLDWKTVQQWIASHRNKDEYGAGYAGNSLPPSGGNAFAALRKEPQGGKGFRVTAMVYFNPRQGPIASNTWEVSKLDHELEKVFGRNLRVKLNV